jgi:predicted nucleic acid-binding protein
MIGLDTGFFIALLQGHGEATTVWSSGLNEDRELVTSCLTLFELQRLGLKGAITESTEVCEAIQAATAVVWPGSSILSAAARLSHGNGIPAIDSLILASLLSRDVDTVYTTDSDLERYRAQHVRVINLRGLE